MEQLSDITVLAVQQQKEWGEILTGFECRNRYTILDAGGTERFRAAEVGGSTLLRFWLKAARPYTMHVLDSGGTEVLKVRRPFTFFLHNVTVSDAAGHVLGRVQRRFTFFVRRYTVTDASGQEIYELYGPVLHPWTFEVRNNGRTVGKITEKWSGLGKEMFTDADTFGLTVDPDVPNEHKAVLLGAVFLVDTVHFENKSD